VTDALHNDPRTDAQLVAACNGGDAAAFEVLYRRHRDYVLRVTYRFARDHQTAMDAMQETFFYLLRKFPPPGEGLDLTAQVTTLLYPVAKHTAIRMAQKARRHVSDADLPGDVAASNDADPHDGDDLAALLASLSGDRRELLTLRFVDGLTLAEIAESLEIPIGTVKSRLHLAIKALRDDPRTKKFFDA
jgi:RNA polymerase sigma-70 factor (ECF subfamily)